MSAKWFWTCSKSSRDIQKALVFGSTSYGCIARNMTHNVNWTSYIDREHMNERRREAMASKKSIIFSCSKYFASLLWIIESPRREDQKATKIKNLICTIFAPILQLIQVWTFHVKVLRFWSPDSEEKYWKEIIASVQWIVRFMIDDLEELVQRIEFVKTLAVGPIIKHKVTNKPWSAMKKWSRETFKVCFDLDYYNEL